MSWKEVLWENDIVGESATSRFKAWPRNTLDSPYFGPFLVTDAAEGSLWINTHPKYGGLAEVGYPQLEHYDVLDDLYDWEVDLQESLEAHFSLF